MIRGFLRTVRYARAWGNGGTVTALETRFEREGRTLPATLLLPARRRGPLPGWVVMGGVTRMGRFHPQLLRFARALSASGAAVLIPEIPEWTDLRLIPAVAAPTVRGAIEALRARPEVRDGKMGLVGLSFGAPQAAVASTEADLAAELATVVLFGGYCDLERTLRCQITGVHEWAGETHRLVPDPYGRWVVAANYLTRVPGYEDADDVAEALRALALAATERRIAAWRPEHDALKDDLREGIASQRRDLFDFIAPLTTAPQPCCGRGDELATQLAQACRRAQPLLEPAQALTRMSVPTRLIHGRDDRLIPYTESLRFRDGVPPGVVADTTVTGMFAHSANLTQPSLGAKVREGAVLFEAVRGLITAV